MRDNSGHIGTDGPGAGGQDRAVAPECGPGGGPVTGCALESRAGTGQAGAGQAGADEAAGGGTGSYLTALRLPGALRFCVAAAVGRMPMSMFGLGSLLLVAAVTGSYGQAGAAAASSAIGYAVCAPPLARLADRFGQRETLRPTALVFGVAAAAFIAVAELRAPLWVMLIFGCLTGASSPSLGSMTRARWSHLLQESPQLLAAAYALESVIDEMIFVVGPAVVTLLATEVLPAAGVATAAVAGLAGMVALATQTRTQPPPMPRTPPPAQPALIPGVQAGPGRRGAGGHQGSHWGAALSRLPAPGLITLAPLFCCVGSMFGTIDVSTVAFAQEQGHKPLAGFILGTYALGSATGGIWYGSRNWRAPLERRFALTLCLTVAAVGSFWSLPGLLPLDVVIFFSGLAISPTLIAGFSLIERQAPPGRRTEGMTWMSSALSVGVAGGSAIAGQIIDAGGAHWGYVYAAGSGLAAAVICLAGLRRLRPLDPAPAGPARA